MSLKLLAELAKTGRPSSVRPQGRLVSNYDVIVNGNDNRDYLKPGQSCAYYHHSPIVPYLPLEAIGPVGRRRPIMTPRGGRPISRRAVERGYKTLWGKKEQQVLARAWPHRQWQYRSNLCCSGFAIIPTRTSNHSVFKRSSTSDRSADSGK